MKIIKSFALILISGILMIGISPEFTYSQKSMKKVRPTEPNVKSEKRQNRSEIPKPVVKTKPAGPFIKGSKKLSESEVSQLITRNKNSYKKNSRGTWLLQEDFESANFPPSGWTVSSGAQEWNQSVYSSNGIGNYSMFYSSWNCNYSNNTIYSPSFSQTQNGDVLIFDYAYAPWNDGNNDYYDDLEIFYYDDNSSSWYSLVYYFGTELQTSPGTNNYFEPLSYEWGTKQIIIPAGATEIYFQGIENCSNNLYIDNIRIGTPIINGNWVLQEDFESGNFPPSGWNVISGNTQWDQYNVSGYGSGNYSMFYSNYICNYSNNIIYTSNFSSPTQFGDKLTFDYAYAPYDDGNIYYDDLEIYYFDDVNQTWNSLEYISGSSLQTAPGTTNYFVPMGNEWGTKSINIPANASAIYFQSWENCSNNFFIDNIFVGSPPANGNEASVEKIWAKGKLPLVYGVPDKISALIKNNSGSPMTNLKVYLNISGANILSDSLTIPSINAGDTMQVDFNGFMPILNGFSTVTISVPDDDDNSNNMKESFTQVNSNSIRYVDSNCCNGSVGYLGEASFLNKYTMSGQGQIRKVKIKISGSGNEDQMVYAVVMDHTGTIVGKSQNYKIQPSDQGKYKTFDISDPKPFIVNNNIYYVGIAQTQYSGNGFAFSPQEFLSDVPARPEANYGGGIAPVGTQSYTFEFSREWGFNFAIEAEIGNQVTIDAGVSDLGLTYDQYFSSTTYSPVGKVFNAGTGSATFTVNRKITPGGYTSTKSVTGLTSGSNANVTFDPWTFTSGTTYTVRDSVILSGDGNISNNVLSSSVTPKIAKQMCVLWQNQDDRDSLVRAINSDGRFANNFDTVRMNYTGTYRPWKYVFANFRNQSNYAPWTRDSLKAYLDNSTAGNKKSLIVFGNAIAFYNDPNITFTSPADSIFYRQYLKSSTISDNWPLTVTDSESKFRGIGLFGGISQDSLSDPDSPELIKPVNGGTAAMKPMSVTGNGNDSCNAVSYTGANYNTFFMTNKFASLRSTYQSPLDGPVLIYTKIIDWLLNSGTNAKVLDIKIFPEGLYDVNTNTIVPDTIKVYLRNATSPFAKVDSGKVNLSSSGHGTIIFNNASNGVNYYLQVIHRNSMEVWSGTPKMFTGNSLSYDFTDASGKAYGDNMKLSGVSWLMFAGDA
ncbi:MAG TPA: hypothetical protein PKD83_07245, partial [Ignavibacteria bacterium]|nr:hypothetical protein [Ignavibacteria bacterium]